MKVGEVVTFESRYVINPVVPKAWTLRCTSPGHSMPWEVAWNGVKLGFFSTWREACDFLFSSIRGDAQK